MAQTTGITTDLPPLLAALAGVADAGVAYAGKLEKLRFGLEGAAAVADGTASTIKMPDGKVGYVPPSERARQRASMVLAMRDIRGFLAGLGFGGRLLEPFRLAGDAAGDASRGVPNPLFETAARFDADADRDAELGTRTDAKTLGGARRRAGGRAPDRIDEDRWVGAAIAAVARRTHQQPQKEAAAEVARIAAGAGRQTPSKQRGGEFDDRTPTGEWLLSAFWKAQKVRLIRPDKRKRDQTSRRVRYFEIAMTATQGMEPLEAAKEIEANYIASPPKLPIPV